MQSRSSWLWYAVLAAIVAVAGCGDDESADDVDGAVVEDPDASTPPSADAAPGVDAAVLPSDLVVDPDWVFDALDFPSLQLIDVRSLGAYEFERIPGALHVDPAALRATVDGIPGQVAPPAEGEAVLAAAGVLRDATVVVYGDGTDTTSTRVMWTLEYYGQADVRFLDGGWGAWEEAGHPGDTSTPPSDTSSYTIDAVDDARRVDKAWVLAHLDDATVTFVDARTPGEYTAGRIPGAINAESGQHVDGTVFKSIDQVAALYAAVDSGDTVVAYCQTGSRASIAYVALRWLGFADVRLYDGSWAEWGDDPSTPKESG